MAEIVVGGFSGWEHGGSDGDGVGRGGETGPVGEVGEVEGEGGGGERGEERERV